MLFHKEPFCGITDWRRREASLRGLALLLCPCSLTMRATLAQAGRFTPETAAHGRIQLGANTREISLVGQPEEGQDTTGRGGPFGFCGPIA